MSIKILACQIDIPVMSSASDRRAHLLRTSALVDDRLSAQSVDLVVLPELSSIHYSREAFANLAALGEPAEGDSLAIWRRIAIKNKCWVAYGFAHEHGGKFSIATALVNRKGELTGVYHKQHLAQFGDSMEKEYFTAGEQKILIAEINDFRIAPIICYDIRAPELCRTLAVDHGVDCILHTSAYSRDPSFYSWRAFAVTRALENQLYFLSLNRAGKHFGSSVFCTPWIDERNPPCTFEEHAEQLTVFELNKAEIQRARSEYTFLQDRLENYQLPVRLITENH